MAHVLEVPSSVTISSSAMFAEQVAHHLEQHESIVLKLDDLNDVDLSFLQIICAARDHANRTDKSFCLAGPAHETVRALLWRAGMLDAPSQDDLDFWFDGAAPQ